MNNGPDASACAPPPIPPLPRTGVGWRFVVAYFVAYTGVWMALLSPILVGLAMRVRALDPAHPIGSLSLIVSTGALLALFGNPFFGQLSDRTTSRFGMRRPWVLAGALGGIVGLTIVARATSIPQALLGWCLVQLAYNAQLAALAAILPDQVPPQQRGTVSGLVGISLPVGMVAGTYLVQALSFSTLAMFVTPAIAAAASAAYLASVLPDRRLGARQRASYGLREFFHSFWIDPRRHPDFGWAWSSRFLFYAGVSVLMTYQGFYLIHQLARTPAEMPRLIFLSTLLQSVAVIVFSGVGGAMSDAFKRRKIFVFGAALIYAVAMLVIAFAVSYPWFLAGMAIGGAGQGMYLAVDLALVTDVLPDREVNAARNLGIFNIATVMPQSLMPMAASFVLAASNGAYTVLFMVAAILVAAGAWAIQPVQGAR